MLLFGKQKKLPFPRWKCQLSADNSWREVKGEEARQQMVQDQLAQMRAVLQEVEELKIKIDNLDMPNTNRVMRSFLSSVLEDIRIKRVVHTK